MLSASNTISLTKKHSLQSKWNIIFDKSPEWISFKPQLGLKVYPCYACKNMFSSKLTFQDHINRRVVIIKYKCVDCTNTLTFYNRCSFLLHTRKHYSMAEGRVNLGNVDIFMLPVDLAGFARHESIPFLYDEDEEFVDEKFYINSQFYTPDDSEAGKQVITMRPYNLVFHYTEGNNNVLMVLKQISSNIPVCQFVNQDYNKRTKTSEPEITDHSNIMEPEIKLEPDLEDDFTLPVISKIESLTNGKHTGNKNPSCPECMCNLDTLLTTHFLGTNRPLNQNLYCFVCKYIAPTKCSYKAHLRTHENTAPFVCPECGKAFLDSNTLNKHMEDDCFHLAKQVRFRCNANKCGKIFIMRNSYASHFTNHFQNVYQCSTCNQHFVKEIDFNQHAKSHDSSCSAVKLFTCLVCNDATPIAEEKAGDHINWHLEDRERCVYIYTCKYCRSYFRSTATYAVHKSKCAKSDKGQPQPLINSTCRYCGQKIVFREKDTYKICAVCKQLNQPPISIVQKPNVVQDCMSSDDKKSSCMLCREELTPEELETHSQVCKYNNPVVNILTLGDDSATTDTNSSSNHDKSNTSSSSDVESKPSISTISNHDSTKLSDDNNKSSSKKNNKRKRSSTSNANNKTKKTSNEDNKDLQADEPVSFDGTYYCKLCYYKSTDRAVFHTHIIAHRDVSTSYQCMECGECFMVKPSLLKHLTHYHKNITNINEYLTANNCYNKEAIEELESNLKLVPGERKGPVKENQCTVCLKQCDSSTALNKHFRIHGMAFLMKKSK